jgi:transcriptional regulator with XRE-family HTH domain
MGATAAGQKSTDAFRTLLRNHRNAQRWSQERLAYEAEMDHSLVSRLESGQRAPTREAVEKLVTGMKLSEFDKDQLLIHAGFFPVHPESAIGHQPEALKLYRLLESNGLPAETKQALVQTLDGLLALAVGHPRLSHFSAD